MNAKIEKAVFEFLDDLRESGITNMFGATPYIEQVFEDLSKKDSVNLLAKWIETFGERMDAKKAKDNEKVHGMKGNNT